MNDDRVEAQKGFGTHPHDNMEIFSYVLDGDLVHRDSMGNDHHLRRGDMQLMSAGSGITHSEFNGADTVTHFLQIWIEPAQMNLVPSYQEKRIEDSAKLNVLRLMLDPGGKDGALTIHADARVYASILHHGNSLELQIPEGRFGWLHLATGSIEVDGEPLTSGDAIEFNGGSKITVTTKDQGEFLLFDLA